MGLKLIVFVEITLAKVSDQRSSQRTNRQRDKALVMMKVYARAEQSGK